MANAPLRRIRRLISLPAEQLGGRLLYRLGRPIFSSGLYNRSRRSPADGAIRSVAADPWPGDPARGREIAKGMFRLAGQVVREPAPLGGPIGADENWRVAFNGFGWLGDLMALGPGAAPVARAFVERWLEENQGWDPIASRPDVMGQRLSQWLAEAALLDETGDPQLRSLIHAAVDRNGRHLARVLPAGLAGQPLLRAIKGLIYAGLALDGEGDKLLAHGLKHLAKALPNQLLADGGHVERSPAVQLSALRDLVDLRAALEATGREPPSDLSLAIDAMAPVLRMFQSGDGGLALFNDSDEGPEGAVDLILLRANAKAKPLASAPDSGFQRLAAGPAVLLVDAGRPAPAGFDGHAHAGSLSFEFYHGEDRVIGNCGAQAAGGDWLSAQRATAAHSTLTVEDTNSSTLLPDGRGLARRPAAVTCRREEEDRNQWLDMSHDGYQPNFGLVHHRHLFLSADGNDLRGHERLDGMGAKRGRARQFAVRFHLHPQVLASISQDGQAVLLRPPGGGGFRLRSSGGEIGLAESVYLGRPGEMRRSQQVVIAGEIKGGNAEIKWALTRESKKK
jgi:uncharacterized heparinase superfamily protein